MPIPYDPFDANANAVGAAGSQGVSTGPNKGGAGKKVKSLPPPRGRSAVKGLPGVGPQYGFGYSPNGLGNETGLNSNGSQIANTSRGAASVRATGEGPGGRSIAGLQPNMGTGILGQVPGTGNGPGGRSAMGLQPTMGAAPANNSPRGSVADRIAMINANDPKTNGALPFMFNGQEINALQAQNILSNPSALSAFLLGNLGYGDTPTMRAMLDPMMQNLPILQLLAIAGMDMGGGNFGGLAYNPDGTVNFQQTITNNPELAGMLTAEGGFNAGADLMRSQFGAGLDPLQLMAQYFQTGQAGNQGTVGAEVFGGRSPSDQVSMANDIITASMMNGNPYMVGVLRALIDALGTTYQAQGATDPNGFAGWLLQNSLFGPLMQGVLGGTGR